MTRDEADRILRAIRHEAHFDHTKAEDYVPVFHKVAALAALGLSSPPTETFDRCCFLVGTVGACCLAVGHLGPHVDADGHHVSATAAKKG